MRLAMSWRISGLPARPLSGRHQGQTGHVPVRERSKSAAEAAGEKGANTPLYPTAVAPIRPKRNRPDRPSGP
jgi:hypothetical protein